MDVQARRAFWRGVGGLADRGTSVLFATHYLEEADEYADRIVVLLGGKVVADGSAAQIKAGVGGRHVRVTVPAGHDGRLRELPGVRGLQRRGESVLWVGTLPFAAFGILVGYLLDADTAQPVTVVATIALALLGGLWQPTATMSETMRQVAHLLPSYHLADLGWRAVAGQPPIASDGLVLLADTVVFAGLAAWRYRRAEART
jgi:hypothetical protein